MALSDLYIFSPALNQYFVNKTTGLPLAGGKLFFFRDESRSTPKEVYQLSGTPPNYTYVALPNPITLNGSGQIVNAANDIVGIFYLPFDDDGNLDLYYVVCEDSGGNQQWVLEAVPFITATTDPSKDTTSVANQIANPQFSRSFLNEGVSTSLSVTAATDEEFPIAPDWTFVVSGTGSVDVQRVAITGNDNVVTSPPYVLDVTVSSGITSCKLRQRMNVNSGLWASTPDQDIFLAGLFVARNEVSGTTGVQMFYEESSGGSPVLIVDGAFDNSEYTIESGTTANAIPLSTNVDSGKDGYIDIYLSFNANTHVRVSSIQVVPTLSSAGGDNVSYDVNSSNREQALMGDYYIPKLVAKPTKDFLTGWNFPLNPAQFGETGAIGAAGGYIWDQTIGARGADAVNYARNAATGGLQLTTTGATNAFYLLQYLTGKEVKDMIGERMAFHMKAWKTNVGDDVTVRVYLFRGSSAATIPTLGTTIGTLAATGVFTLTAANWTAIPRSGLDVPQFTLNEITQNSDINDDANNYGFSEWQVTDNTQIGDTDKFAIVVTFRYETTATVITVNSISVTPGDLPCPPAQTSFEEALTDCQYYYEKSYDTGTAVGTPGSSSALVRLMTTQGSAPVNAHAAAFGFEYLVQKRVTTPTVTLYTPGAGAATPNQVFAILVNGGAIVGSGDVGAVGTFWALRSNGSRAVDYIANSAANLSTAAVAANAPYAVIEFHYVVDARLGIV